MGFGDELMTAGEARLLQKHDPRPVVIVDRDMRPRWHEVFDNNPRLVRGAYSPTKHQRLRRHKRFRPYCVDSGPGVMDEIREHLAWLGNTTPPYYIIGDRRLIPTAFANEMAARPSDDAHPFGPHSWIGGSHGIELFDQLKKPTAWRSGYWVYLPHKIERGEIYFSEKELEEAEAVRRRFGACIIVNHHIKHTVRAGKDWGRARYDELVTILGKHHRILQLGPRDTSVLPGVTFVRTDTFRQACAILSRSAVYVGTEGGMHHAAGALGVPAVVLFGTCVPRTLGYDGQIIFSVDDPHTPCGHRNVCRTCIQKMALISPLDVAAAVVDSIRGWP
jgi:ADP-heptose:LPS heptosyltransferase